MQIVAATVYSLQIPFKEAFSHATKSRITSDSIVVRVTGDDGALGYGECLPRPYVTGETVSSCLDHMCETLWPVVRQSEFTLLDPGEDPISSFARLSNELPMPAKSGGVVFHAARCAFEIAIIDCALKSQGLSLNSILIPKRSEVLYSGVISAGSIENAVKLAAMCRNFGFSQVKVKIQDEQARERLSAIREEIGPDVSIRVDANGAYDVPTAIAVLNDIADLQIDCAEQPIPRGRPEELAQVCEGSPIPIMADESLVTVSDAEALAAAGACQYFNLRLSKCGGLAPAIEMAGIAEAAGLRYQLGCQVGETAILSAAGRAFAAWLEAPEYVEGSFGSLLLEQDISHDRIEFGKGGSARVLDGQGLGITVDEERLRNFSDTIIQLGQG